VANHVAGAVAVVTVGGANRVVPRIAFTEKPVSFAKRSACSGFGRE
jgi:hypothetical protein